MRLARVIPPFVLAAASAASAATLPAQTPSLRPQPSGRATSEVTLAVPSTPGAPAPAGATPKSIRVDYGQPHLRGRRLHTDSLVPYGAPWRTGANARTTLRTEVPLTLGTAPLDTGTYVLWTLPTPAGWTLIVQKPEALSADDYEQRLDVARVPLRRRELPAPIESLTMWLIPSTAPGAARGELRLAWGTVELSTDWSVR